VPCHALSAEDWLGIPLAKRLAWTSHRIVGEPVTAQVETLQGALDASLRAWLENLKRTA
jgi:hypothetical protein